MINALLLFNNDYRRQYFDLESFQGKLCYVILLLY